MTVETTSRKQNFDGGQSDLEFTFRALPESPEDIKCIATNAAGDITDLEYGVDYTVVINSDGIGGTVTVNPTFATTYTHTVYRETTIKQESDYDDYNPFPADTLETNIDRLTMIAQEERELGERTLKYPISASGTDTNLPVPEAGKFIAWNDDGDGLENKDIPDPSTLVKASQAEAEAGTDNDNFMTPLRTKQAIDELVVHSNDIPLSYLSTSGTLAENSDTKVASQKATKTYADTKIPKTDIDTTATLGTSDTKVPSQKAVKTYVDGKGYFFHVQDQKPAGTKGGTFTAGSWTARVLNTSVTNEISGASVKNNRITLPAGTYYIEASAPAYRVLYHKLRLQNITDATTALLGTTEWCSFESEGQNRAFIGGRVIIAATKVFELQHICSTTVATEGYGPAYNFSVVEVYADVRIWKV